MFSATLTILGDRGRKPVEQFTKEWVFMDLDANLTIYSEKSCPFFEDMEEQSLKFLMINPILKVLDLIMLTL